MPMKRVIVPVRRSKNRMTRQKTAKSAPECGKNLSVDYADAAQAAFYERRRKVAPAVNLRMMERIIAPDTAAALKKGIRAFQAA